MSAPRLPIKFSIVMPVYNGEKHIERTIKSILGQVYLHFELLILENCSTDHTLEVIQRFDDSRIKVIPAPQFLSIEDNWSRMLALELSEFITIVCHDDPLYPEYLAEIVRLIEAEPDASLYHTHFHLVNENDQILRNCQPVPYRESAEEFLRRAHLNQEDLVGTGYTMRSEDFRQVGGFPPLPRLLFADVLCWAYLAQLRYKVCSERYLYGFRSHPDSTGRLATIDAFYAAGKAYLAALQSIPHDHQLAVNFIRKFVKQRCHMWLYRIMMSDAPDRFEQYQAIKRLVQAQAQQDRIFSVYPLPVILHEQVARIPSLAIRTNLVSLIQGSLALKGVILRQLRRLTRHDEALFNRAPGS